MTLYEVPREKGERKGVVITVFGFGEPKPLDECRDKAPGSGVEEITKAPNPVQLGHDLYEVFWCNPHDFLQRNGFVLKELIEDIRPTLTGAQKFYVGGSSMGGLISRYILTRLESEGFDHGVDVWVTRDSPLKGAYVPLSVLFLADLFSKSDFISGLFQNGDLLSLA